MSAKYAALFVREDSAYKRRKDWDCFDIKRDARSFNGGKPCVCHPPCRAWGLLSHMAFNVRPDEKQLALFSIEQVRKNGGIIEHPSGSRLFKQHLPDAGMFPDEFGGFTIKIDQFDFGHVAHKETKLYICGIKLSELPAIPSRRVEFTDRSICGNVKGTTRCTQYQREYSPDALIDWFEKVLDLIPCAGRSLRK